LGPGSAACAGARMPLSAVVPGLNPGSPDHRNPDICDPTCAGGARASEHDRLRVHGPAGLNLTSSLAALTLECAARRAQEPTPNAAAYCGYLDELAAQAVEAGTLEERREGALRCGPVLGAREGVLNALGAPTLRCCTFNGQAVHGIALFHGASQLQPVKRFAPPRRRFHSCHPPTCTAARHAGPRAS